MKGLCEHLLTKFNKELILEEIKNAGQAVDASTHATYLKFVNIVDLMQERKSL